MTDKAAVTVLELAGRPRERGRIHGEALRPLVQEGVARWQYQLFRRARE